MASEKKKTWAEETYERLKELECSGVVLTQEQCETLAYCEECFAEDARDAEYLGCYTAFY